MAEKPKPLQPDPNRCQTCGGAGRVGSSEDDVCDTCKGTGRKPYPERANRLK